MPKKKRKKKEKNLEQPTVYVDSDYLLAYIYKEKDKYYVAKEIRSVPYNIVIPFIVIGEVINKIFEKEKDNTDGVYDKTANLLQLIKKIGADIKPATKEALMMAKKCLEIENYLNPTDAVIFAQAVCDKNSVRLYTFDSVLINSALLQEIEENLRSTGERLHPLKVG
ncbi:type II toxin-antitoxin system VapC family toxin [Archaeoglobus neptunius]|uniref:type II toxin-antitoxin system VapC family toxin n=1 Tax=Archaeoglobus neptunius TaxID=2798580 RepID=UPI0019259F60